MKRIKASPYLTSGIFFLIGGIVILLLNPFNIHRYKFVESSACFDLLANGQSLYAYDLDFDGNSEFIKFKTNTVGESSFVIYDQFKIDHGQEDFNGNYHEGWVNRFFGDFDNNGLGEVYFCRLTGDWLSLTVTEFGGDGVQTIRDRPIIQLKDSTNLGDTPIHIRELVDLNNDGFKELILSANAGYSLQPRSIFLYDIHLDSIVPFTWYKNKVGFTLAQASERNNLGKIFLTDHGPENLDQDDKAFMANKTIPLVVDYCGRPIGDWQTVHIDTLDYMVYLPGFEGEESVIGIGMGTNHKTSWAYAWNHLGHLVDSIQLLANGVAMGKVGVIKELTNGEVIVKGVDGSIVMLLKGLRIKVLRKVSPNWSYRGVIDLNDDGINEVLGREGLSNLVVYDINFKHETSAELLANTEDPSRFRFSKFYVDGKPQLMVLTGPEAQFFIYKSNPMTWLQFLIFLAIMGFVWLLI